MVCTVPSFISRTKIYIPEGSSDNLSSASGFEIVRKTLPETSETFTFFTFEASDR